VNISHAIPSQGSHLHIMEDKEPTTTKHGVVSICLMFI